MAEITRFLGMNIGFCSDLAAGPHVHVNYNNHTCSISVENYGLMSGSLPKQALLLAIEWVIDNSELIKKNWELHKSGQPVPAMRPLTD